MNKNKLLYTAFIFANLLFIYCAGPKTIAAVPNDNQLSIATKRWPDATLETLKAGHTIYITKCNTCHGLKSIPTRSEENWLKEISEMAPKAKLTASETETLSRYILSARVVK